MTGFADIIAQELKSSFLLDMEITLKHYLDTPMTELQIAGSAFTGIIFVTF